MNYQYDNLIPEISVDLTYHCMFNCPFCSSSCLHEELNSSTAQYMGNFLKLIGDRYKKLPIATIGGGEPFLNANLLNVLNLWKDKTKYFRIYTTFSFKYNRSQFFQLYLSKLRSIIVSVHAINKKIQTQIFGDLYNWEQVVKNISIVKDMGMTIEINFLLTKLNIDEFEDVVGFCKVQNIGTLRVLSLSPQGNAIRNWKMLNISKKKREQFIEQVNRFIDESLQIELSGFPEVRRCVHSSSTYSCLAGISYFHVNADGTIFPCPSFKAIPKESLGNIQNLEMFKHRICELPKLEKIINLRCQKLFKHVASHI